MNKNMLSPTHPSNVFKFCPRCGAHYFPFDGIKKFMCTNCGFIYYLNAATAVAVIVELPNKNIILTQRRFEPAAGKYDLPGGFVDIGEAAELAAIREVKEEINIDLKLDQLQFLSSFPNVYEFKGITYFTCDIAFIAKYHGIQNFEANDDVQDIAIVQPHYIDFEKISFDSIRSILRVYRQKFL